MNDYLLDDTRTEASPKIFLTGIPDQKPRICGNCKFWERADEAPRGYYQAEGYCTNPRISDYLPALDGSSDVKENFGCILFEERQEL